MNIWLIKYLDEAPLFNQDDHELDTMLKVFNLHWFNRNGLSQLIRIAPKRNTQRLLF